MVVLFGLVQVCGCANALPNLAIGEFYHTVHTLNAKAVFLKQRELQFLTAPIRLLFAWHIHLPLYSPKYHLAPPF
ncbi:hypothetical protein BGZ63DRAFT_387229 [Mariannaea sp. PMI_226]|nr:hypothetical protein BGZ63DRAFT_387229 [Mariannaea sp. PMI_226]